MSTEYNTWREKRSELDFAMGMATAFCECVSNGCKKIALSAPVSMEEKSVHEPIIGRIVNSHGLSMVLDSNEDVGGFCWWIIYKRDCDLQDYLALRKQGKNPAVEIQAFKSVLSYGNAFEV